MVYDVTSADTFVNVKRWLHEIDQNCDDVCRVLGKQDFPTYPINYWCRKNIYIKYSNCLQT